MLDFLKIENFKTLRRVEFELGPLTLFSGRNAMGKSTAMQALLLLRQSFERGALAAGRLVLNDRLIEIGTGLDALAESSDDETIRFHVALAGEAPIQFEFAYSAESDLLVQSNTVASPESLAQLFGRRFQYLSADRLGPKVAYPLSAFHVDSLASLGIHGEFTSHFIARHRDRPVSLAALKHPDAVSSFLGDNLDAWMSLISPGLRINAEVVPSMSVARLGFKFVNGRQFTREYRPQNVGFGLTYALPVVTALLSAQEDDLVLIENPESHLHPAGQAALGRLCALAAQAGAQLLIESHSDHFLNGIRVAIHRGEVDPRVVELYFLDRDISSEIHETVVTHPRVNAQGRLDQWPLGFFDEWDRQLAELL
jgi:predicted ATPase